MYPCSELRLPFMYISIAQKRQAACGREAAVSKNRLTHIVMRKVTGFLRNEKSH